MFSFSFLTFSLPPSFLLFSYSPFVFFSSFLFFFSSFLFSSTYFLPFIPSVSLYHFLPFPVFKHETTFLVPFFYPVLLNSPLLSFIEFLPSSFSSSSTSFLSPSFLYCISCITFFLRFLRLYYPLPFLLILLQ